MKGGKSRIHSPDWTKHLNSHSKKIEIQMGNKLRKAAQCC